MRVFIPGRSSYHIVNEAGRPMDLERTLKGKNHNDVLAEESISNWLISYWGGEARTSR